MKFPKFSKSAFSAPKIALANEAEADAEVSLIFPNEAAPPVRLNLIGADGVAIVELAPYGEAIHRERLANGKVIVRRQRFTKEDAEIMANEHNRLLRLGAPWYIGHPDHRAFREKYQDFSRAGRIRKLEAGPTGILAHVKFNATGQDLVRAEAFAGHSPNWLCTVDAGGAFRPRKLLSVGFTDTPNLKVPQLAVANQGAQEPNPTIEDNHTMNPKIRETLLANGLIQPGADDAAVETALITLANEIVDLRAKATTLANEKAELATQLQTATDAAESEKTKNATLANELAGSLVDGEIAAGRILTGKRDEAIAKLLGTDAGAINGDLIATLANEFGPEKPMKTGATTEGLGARRSENPQSRSAARIALANELGGGNFERGWELAKRQKPELFIETPGESEGDAQAAA